MKLTTFNFGQWHITVHEDGTVFIQPITDETMGLVLSKNQMKELISAFIKLC